MLRTLTLAVCAVASGLQAQKLDRDFGPRVTDPRSSWTCVTVPMCGAEFWIPKDFTRLPISRFRAASYQGKLGGVPVRLHLNVVTGGYETVSRALLSVDDETSLEEVIAYRIDGEPAAVVRRRTREPNRTILEVVVCPRRRAVSLELQLPANHGPQAIAESQRLLSYLRLMERRGVTVAERKPERLIEDEIRLGFVEKMRDKVEVEESDHYRVYGSAGSRRKLNELLETKLIPLLTSTLGKPHSRFAPGKLPVFLHRTQNGYTLAALKLGLQPQQVEAMQGYSWDRYYSTWYSGPKSSIHIHEGTHQYVTAVLGLDGGGPWLQEGFAQWLEAHYAKRDVARAARNLLRRKGNRFPRLRRILALKTFLGRGEKAGLTTGELYDSSASVVRYLAQQHHNEFRDFFLQTAVLPAGYPHLLDAALERTINRDIAGLERDWRKWLLENDRR